LEKNYESFAPLGW
jgi:20S proteasome subunit alpha 6